MSKKPRKFEIRNMFESRNTWLTSGYEFRDGDFWKDHWVSILSILLPKYRSIPIFFDILHYYRQLYWNMILLLFLFFQHYPKILKLWKFVDRILRKTEKIEKKSCLISCQTQRGLFLRRGVDSVFFTTLVSIKMELSTCPKFNISKLVVAVLSNLLRCRIWKTILITDFNERCSENGTFPTMF